MARIRTIQPDLPYSESLSRVILEAELLWPRLFIVFDDEGRARADIELLAAQLFPRRRGQEQLVRMCLDEYEREGMIERYRVEYVEYMRAVNWRRHQRVDRPTPSRLPASPQELAKAREASRGRDRTADKMLEQNDNPVSVEVAREMENLPRTADGSLDIGREWVKERAVEQYFEAKAEGNRDHMLRSMSMVGRLIGWSGEERGSRRKTAANDAAPSSGPPHSSLFTEEMKTSVPEGHDEGDLAPLAGTAA